MNRAGRDLVAALEAHGYELDRTNTKGIDFWTREGHEVPVSSSVSEHTSRHLIRAIEKHCGTAAAPNKRKPDQIRERQAKRRDALRADIARHEAELADIRARKARQLSGLGDVIPDSEIRRIEAYIERQQRELREIERLMAAPALDNRVRHRAGTAGR